MEKNRAFCASFGGFSGAGSTPEEAMDSLLAHVKAQASQEVQVGEAEDAWLPIAIGTALPIPPAGMELVVLQRSWREYVEVGYQTHEAVDTPYEWRYFAVPNGEHAAVLKGSFGAGNPSDLEVGCGTVVARFVDQYLRSGSLSLPQGSVEYLDGAWMPCEKEVRIPYRLEKGASAPVPPEGFGLLSVSSHTSNEGSDCDWGLYALPLGSRPPFKKEKEVVISEEPATRSFYWDYGNMCADDKYPQLPEGSVKFVDGAWLPCRVCRPPE